MRRESNQYLISIPVSPETARLLSSETNWRILGALKEAGVEGLTVEELSKKTKTPKSIVYNMLEKLQAAEWVEGSMRRYSWRSPSRLVWAL